MSDGALVVARAGAQQRDDGEEIGKVDREAERGEDVDDVIAKIQASRRAVEMVNQSRIVDHKRRKEAVLTWMGTLYVSAGVQRWARRHGLRNCRCSCRLPSLMSSRRRR